MRSTDDYKLHIITDVDGIFTSANLTFTANVGKSKHFSVNDSLVTTFLRERFGDLVKIQALTGDKDSGLLITENRLDYMQIPIVQCKNVFKYHWIKEHFDISKIVFIGDDIYDIAIFKECKYGCTVSNAPTIVQKNASYVSPFEGGKNGFTDIIFKILETQLGVDVEQELLNYVRNKEKEYHDRKNSPK
jgi:3-deoxy-D-manno-octulosonate 8-phosphate phosphatase (KDO 8-P phosphatase)